MNKLSSAVCRMCGTPDRRCAIRTLLHDYRCEGCFLEQSKFQLVRVEAGSERDLREGGLAGGR